MDSKIDILEEFEKVKIITNMSKNGFGDSTKDLQIISNLTGTPIKEIQNILRTYHLLQLPQ